MREKKLLNKVVGFAAVSFAVLFLWVAYSAAVAEAPEEIVIENKVWAKEKYGPVKFSHAKHAKEYKIPCKECHHVYKDGKNVWEEGQEVQKCSACHNVYKLGKELKDATEQEKKLSLYKAYHDNCKGCHAKEKKGPVKCTECHALKGKEKK